MISLCTWSLYCIILWQVKFTYLYIHFLYDWQISSSSTHSFMPVLGWLSVSGSALLNKRQNKWYKQSNQSKVCWKSLKIIFIINAEVIKIQVYIGLKTLNFWINEWVTTLFSHIKIICCSVLYPLKFVSLVLKPLCTSYFKIRWQDVLFF